MIAIVNESYFSQELCSSPDYVDAAEVEASDSAMYVQIRITIKGAASETFQAGITLTYRLDERFPSDVKTSVVGKIFKNINLKLIIFIDLKYFFLSYLMCCTWKAYLSYTFKETCIYYSCTHFLFLSFKVRSRAILAAVSSIPFHYLCVQICTHFSIISCQNV